jgi:hypothetical protein
VNWKNREHSSASRHASCGECLWITRGRIRQWFEVVVQVADLNGGNATEIIGLANSGAASSY